MAETGSTMEIDNQNEGAYNHNESEEPSLDSTSDLTSEKEFQNAGGQHIVDESGDYLAPLLNTEGAASADFVGTDSDRVTDSEAGITDSEPFVTDSEAGATDSEVGAIDSEVSELSGLQEPSAEAAANPLETLVPSEGTPVDLPPTEKANKVSKEGEESSKKEETQNNENIGEATAAKHRRPVIDASKLKDKSDRQQKYRSTQLQLQKKTIDQQKQSKEQKRQAVEERRKKQDEEKKVHRQSIVRRSIERSQSAGSREKRRSWDPAKPIPSSAPPRGRSMERLNDTPEVTPAGIGVNKRLSSSVSTLWNPVQLVRLGPNENDWFEVHTPRPKELRSPSPGIDDSNSTYTPRHHSSSPNLASATSQNKSSPSTPIRRTPTGSRGRSTEKRTPSPAQPAAKPSTSEQAAANKTQRPPSPKGFRAPSPKPSTGTPTSSSNSSAHVRQPSLRLKKNNATAVDGKSPADKTSIKAPVSKSSQPPPIKKALTPAKSSPTRTPKTPSTKKPAAASKTPTTTTRTSGAKTPTSSKAPVSKTTPASKTPNNKVPPPSKTTPTPKAVATAPKAAPAAKETSKVTSPIEEEPPKIDSPTAQEPDRKSPVSEASSSPPPELTAEERAKQALAEKRRQMREKAEREAELERQRIEQERIEEEERLKREEEERIREEEEQQRLAEEYRKAEEERLQKAIEEQQRKEEEERLHTEEEERRKEVEERIKVEEKRRREEELTEQLKKDEEARDARKKRVDEIMKRARRGTPVVKNDDEQQQRDNRDEDKDIDTKAEKENGIQGNIYNDDNDKYRNYIENGSAVASHEALSDAV